MARSTTNPRTAGLPPAVGLVIAVAVLYFGRKILIPFALALLFAFLLSPLVKRLETWRLPRPAAVATVMLVAFGLIGAVGWIVTNQLLEIITRLPSYRENVHRKIEALKPRSGGIGNAIQNVEDLGKEFTNPAAPTPVISAPPPTSPKHRGITPSPAPLGPVPVEVVEPPPSPLQSLRDFLGPLLEPIETTGIVIVFTLFMLLNREDLRNRLLGLIGPRQLHLTTRALDDAAQRVSRYLTMQFLVNATFGAIISLGLYLIGVQTSLLWGVIAMLLRFLPYVGPLIGGALPFAISLATTNGWHAPLLVVLLFLVVELATGNVVEPLVYGANTGLSAVAILLSLVFWTLIWGPVGLILATPLTVCLGVLGRYSPHLQFLEILLGDEPVLSPDAQFYQRLLALDQQDALSQIEALAKERPLVELYDTVMIPALALAERDRHGGSLEEQRLQFILQSINEFVTELAEHGSVARKRRPVNKSDSTGDAPVSSAQPMKENRIFCVPAHDTADEITSAMLAQVATREGFPAVSFPVTESPEELIAGVSPEPGDVVCISSVPPLAITHARQVGQQIREALPDINVLIGLWSYLGGTTNTIERLQEATSGKVVTSLGAAMERIRELSQNAAEAVQTD